MIRVSANLFRIASLTVSSEETRYYLNGVFVEPHHSGVGATLTSTDGHRLLSIYDQSGHCDKPAIVKLSPEALQACKAKKSDGVGVRFLIVENGDATVEIGSLDDGQYASLERVAFSAKCMVDGSFPDYRRVIPDYEAIESKVKAGKEKRINVAYDQSYLASFCEIAKELSGRSVDGSKYKSFRGNILMTGGTTGEPMLIQFPRSPIAVGVLMPMRVPTDFKPGLPDWFAAKPAASKAA